MEDKTLLILVAIFVGAILILARVCALAFERRVAYMQPFSTGGALRATYPATATRDQFLQFVQRELFQSPAMKAFLKSRT